MYTIYIILIGWILDYKYKSVNPKFLTVRPCDIEYFTILQVCNYIRQYLTITIFKILPESKYSWFSSRSLSPQDIMASVVACMTSPFLMFEPLGT